MYLFNEYSAQKTKEEQKLLSGKRVAMLVSNSCASDARVIKMAEAVADMGAEVKVFGVYKNSENIVPYDVINGVIYQRNHWMPMAKVKKYTKKIPKKLAPLIAPAINKMAFSFSKYHEFKDLLCKDVIAFNPDIIHAHDLLTLKLGEECAKETGAKLIYDAHEYEIHRNPPLPEYMKRYVKHIEGSGLSIASQAITCGELIAEELVDLYDIKNMEVIYNSPRISPLRGYDIKQQIGLGSGTPLIVYVGKITQGRGIEEIIDLLSLQLPNVHYACVGPCDKKSAEFILGYAKKKGIEKRFHLVPPVHFDNVVSFIKTADLGIVSVMPVTRSYYYAMPNKLFEMAFAGLPILINNLAEAAPVVKKYKLGEVYDSDNPVNLAYYIDYMLKNKNQYNNNEALHQEFWDKYSWEAQVRKLAKIYARLSD